MRKISTQRKTRKIFYLRNKSFIVIAATLFCLAAASITSMQTDKRATAQPEGEGYPIARQIQYSFTLQNTSHQVIEKANLWTFAPVKLTAHQRCLKLQSNYPYKLLTDESNNQVLHFTFENLAPYGSCVVIIKADLLVGSDQS